MNENLNIEEEDAKFRKERKEQDAEEERLYLKRWVYRGNSIPFFAEFVFLMVNGKMNANANVIKFFVVMMKV